MSGTIVPSPVGDDDARLGSNKTAAADQPATSPAPAPAPQGVGQQLQTARLARGLTAIDVAKALKLSLRQVDALEADDWASLPCNTIIRGFVRNYARLLGLDSDLLMAELDRATMPQGAELEMSVGTPVSLPAEGKVDRRDFVRVVSGLVVLLLAVSAYFFLPQELLQSTVEALKSATQSAAVRPVAKDNVVAAEPEATPEPASAPTAEANPASVSIAADPAPAATPAATASAPAAVAPTPAAGAASAPAAIPASAPSPVPGAAVLRFSFDQPSWVEVRDGSGKVVFSKKNEAGTERDVEGLPPFAVTIGNAGHVSLKYKGKNVDLSSRSKGDVARLTIE